MRHQCPVLTFLLLSLAGTTARAAPIIGMAWGGGGTYLVDPITGAVTSIGSAGDIPTSTGPAPGTFIISTGVNSYFMTYPGFQWTLIDTVLTPNGTFSIGDTAYDPSTGTIYALGSPQNSRTLGFGPLIDVGVPMYPFTPGTHYWAPNFLANNVSYTIIEYIPGIGMYATNGFAAYLINLSTGVATPMPPLFYNGPMITGLAYDHTTGRLIGVGGSLDNPSAVGYLYNINPLTGQVTVLNSNAPNLYGIAAVNDTPEPATLWLGAVGLAALLMARRNSAKLV